MSLFVVFLCFCFVFCVCVCCKFSKYLCSCRIERFLGAADEEDFEKMFDLDPEAQIQRSNWQVVNCSTPANYFHVLRRQVPRNLLENLTILLSNENKQTKKQKNCRHIAFLGQARFPQASDCCIPQTTFETEGMPVRDCMFPLSLFSSPRQ